MSNTLSSARLRSSSIKLAVLGAFAFSAQVACSDEPAATPNPFGASGSGSGGSGTAGAPAGTSGSSPFGTSGSGTGGAGTAGSPFGTAGTPATGGAGTGGTGGASAGTGGTGGTGIVISKPYCEEHPAALAALPFEVTTSFYPSAWQGDHTQIAAPAAAARTPDYCAAGARAPGAVGGCSAWKYTPNVTTPSWAAVAWSTYGDANFTHDPVCLPEDATALTFLARGVKGGEQISVGGLSTEEKMIELTTEWKRYSISLAGVVYNSAETGVKGGFSWKVDPGTTPVVVEFYIDSIQVVKGDLPDPGGEGGAGNEGAGGAP